MIMTCTWCLEDAVEAGIGLLTGPEHNTEQALPCNCYTRLAKEHKHDVVEWMLR